MTPAVARVYRLFKRADGQAASVRSVVIAMVIAACAVVAVGVVRVARQHEVLRLGYQLSLRAEHLRELHEVRRRLEVEAATLTTPERVRRLATELGMTTVAPDRIRVVHGHHQVAAQP
jgi:cell division protein FtsL